MAAYVYIVEFQKRGLPHAHFLIILKPNAKITTPESFDEIVSIEIPSIIENKILYLAVIAHMMHGLCGYLNLNNVCIKKNSTCRNGYPKPFCFQTSKGKNCYLKYRQRNDGKKIQNKRNRLR